MTHDPGTAAAQPREASLAGAVGLLEPVRCDDSHLVRLAARLLRVPAAGVTQVSEGEALFELQIPLPEAFSAPREALLACAASRLFVTSGEVVAVGDVRNDPRIENRDALVESGVVAYAGAPAAARDGRVLGTLCVFDTAPRCWTEEEMAILRDLAASVGTELELRRELDQGRQAEERLRRNALYDPLTDLPNRLLFMERLSHAILRARRRQDYLAAVLFLDLDRFKVVNDSLGHHAGDELLSAVAERLKACLRTEDTVARLGGDEFAVLLEDIGDIADATRVAERIQQEMNLPVNLSGYEVFTSASIGIALSSSAYARPEYLLRNADMAMYRAKTSGGARYDVFDRTMHAEALARLQLETDLRRAVERRDFRLHYQPIIALDTGRIAGFEALLRWQHPEQGPISPAEFIPVAEETGLILPIGRWVLGEACQQLQYWHAKFPGHPSLSMSVNLSVRQFSQPDLVGQVAQVLAETGLDPHQLKLEITESVIVENTDFATAMLSDLKALGVQVYMDDFGTGYSSLSYLHRLPLDALKIDRSFVSEMEQEGKHLQLVRTILTLAQSVGVSVVAEGVSTDEQLAVLRALRCEYGQGFLFSRAVDELAAEELLSTDRRW
jgi:diguanylate cyclase (GGDEF)-like protein